MVYMVETLTAISYKHSMSQFTYTGVGARNTPDRILDIMEHVGYVLAQRGYVLRSGGAEGADKAFEAGCDAAHGNKKIYIPWSGFNNYIPDGVSIMIDLRESCRIAQEQRNASNRHIEKLQDMLAQCCKNEDDGST